MQAWQAIQRVVDVLETDDLTIEELAGVACLSPFYFQRLFARLVGRPVGEYAKLRKLARASELLPDTNMRILDIALQFGFSDHANFTRAFRNAYGLTPEEYRLHPIHLNHCIKADVSVQHINLEEGVPLITDDMVVEVNRRRLENPRPFYGIENILPDSDLSGGRETGISAAALLWKEFHQANPAGKTEIGVLSMKQERDACATYFVGAEQPKKEDCSCFTLPVGDYVVCSLETESFEQLISCTIHKTMRFMQVWMKQHNIECGKFSAELYDGTSSMELWIPVAEDSTAKQLRTFSLQVNSPLFESLCSYLEETYQCKPIVEFSKCSMQYGWNIKYKKGGRSLCTLYPQEGSFLALVVIGQRESAEAELLLPFLTDYVQQLFAQTKTGMGQKWLMIEVASTEVLEDVKQLITLRRATKGMVVRWV